MSDEVPSLVPGVDISKLPLTFEDAMVVTRVDGRTRVDELAKLIGRPLEEVSRALQRLVGMGAVTLKTVAKPSSTRSIPAEARPGPKPEAKPGPKPEAKPAPKPEAKPALKPEPKPAPRAPQPSSGPKVPMGDGPHDFGSYVFMPGQLAETTDIDLEMQKKILFTDEHLSVWTHFELLALDRKAEAKAVKLAYFERSKEWHPDRFRRFKQMGSFARKIDNIYKRMNVAYKVLGHAADRAEYEATLPKVIDASDVDAILREQIQAERDLRREEEAKERRLKKNPILARFAKAKEFCDRALELEKEGKLEDAVRTAQLATTFDDRRPEIVALYERLRDAHASAQAAVWSKRGGEAESKRSWDEAIYAYQKAIELTPTSGELQLRHAYSLLQGGRPADEIMPHAHRALTLVPNDAESHYVIARCYEDRGNDKGAQRHYEKALELRPKFAEAEKRIKRSKWSF